DIDPFRAAVKQLSSIPGVKALAGTVIVSEIGLDMSRFSSDGHLVSWAGICPRSDESAGKRRSNRLRKGAPWLKTTLVLCQEDERRSGCTRDEGSPFGAGL